MFKKLRTVIYHVDDLLQAKAWYIRVTGKQPYFDEPYYVGFDINGCELGLDPDTSGVEGGNNAVSFWSVDDLSAVFNTLLSIGAAPVQDITEVGGGIRIATLRDPFGNTFGLIEESV